MLCFCMHCQDKGSHGECPDLHPLFRADICKKHMLSIGNCKHFIRRGCTLWNNAKGGTQR